MPAMRAYADSRRCVRSLAIGAALILSWSAGDAQDSCRVRGRLTGSDGKPMRSAFLRPYGPGRSGRLQATGPDGSFSVAFPRPGGYFLVLGGVHHRTVFMPLLFERPGALDLTVRLGAADYANRFDSVRVIGSFNGFAPESAIPMARLPDGTFGATVPCDTDTLRYQMLGVQAGGFPICGTHADTFVVDRTRPLIEGRSHSFVSTLKADRRPVRITFDAALLPRGQGQPVITFADSRGSAARIAEVERDVKRRSSRLEEAYLAFKAAGGAPDSFRWDPSPDLKDLAAQADRDRDPMVRGFLLLSCIRLAPALIDSTRAMSILAQIPPDSPLWSLVWGGPVNAFFSIARDAKHSEAARRYAERVLEVHPDSSVRAASLYELLAEAQESGDKDRAGRYYTRLQGDYPGTDYAEMSKKEFGPSRAIMKGKAIPDFAFASLEDSTRIYRAAGFKGKYVLLDFWATWCGPCVGELRFLHRAHEEYKDRGLIILSVSFDERPEAVKRFRAGKWPMPWLHAFQATGFASEAARAFEIVGIPRPILIDPDGTIVAVDEELRREKLDVTLATVLGGRPTVVQGRD